MVTCESAIKVQIEVKLVRKLSPPSEAKELRIYKKIRIIFSKHYSSQAFREIDLPSVAAWKAEQLGDL